MVVFENAHPFSQRGKNRRIYSQSKNAIRKRKNYNSNPHSVKKHSARDSERREKRREHERALLKAKHSADLPGVLFFFNF